MVAASCFLDFDFVVCLKGIIVVSLAMNIAAGLFLLWFGWQVLVMLLFVVEWFMEEWDKGNGRGFAFFCGVGAIGFIGWISNLVK